MAKGLGVDQESKQKPSQVVKDGNVGWQPQPKGNQKLRSKLNISATPSIPNK